MLFEATNTDIKEQRNLKPENLENDSLHIE